MNQNNNAVACQELTDFYYARHAQLQKYLFWHVRSVEVAEELAQETYLRFLKQSEPKQILDLNAFLFTIAANLARDHLRSVKRGQAREFVSLDVQLPDTKPNTEEIIASQCLENQLQQAILNLPEKTQEVFLLYHADDYSYKQIAAHLNISTRTVEYHLRQALILCRSFLTKL